MCNLGLGSSLGRHKSTVPMGAGQYPVGALTGRITGSDNILAKCEEGNMKGTGQIQVKYGRGESVQAVLNEVFRQLAGAGIKFAYKAPKNDQLFLCRQPYDSVALWMPRWGDIIGKRLVAFEEKKEEDWFTKLDDLLGDACLDAGLCAKVVEHFKKFKPEKE